jgi:regulatory protein
MADRERFNVLLRKAMASCAGKECCRSEIRQKLSSWSAGEKEAEKILQQLVKEKFIDEARYAAAFARDKFRYNKWGRIKIGAALRQKEISSEIISLAFESIDDNAYREALKTIISSHRRTVKAKNQYDLKGKLLRYGLSKGFESHLLYDILNESSE